MKRIFALITLVCVLFPSALLAHTSKSSKESKTPSEVIEFILFINKNNLIELNGKVLGSDVILGDIKVHLDQEFVELTKKSSSQNGFEKRVFIKADDSSQYEYFAKTIVAVRKTGYSFKVIASSHSDPYVFTPQELDRRNLKPNPMWLFVIVNSKGDIKLNRETQGNIKDFSVIKNRLAGIFDNRKRHRAYLTGTTTVDATTVVKAPFSMKFGDVKKVVDAVKEAGASPVGLQVDDLEQ